MIYEFIGLPGSGKSTIFTTAAQLLKKAGHQTTTMRMLAKQALEEDHRKIGFLRRRVQRASLYGAMAFAQDNPRVFELLHANARGDLSTSLWNMEMLSHLHFAAWRGLPDQPVFMDEGYLHRAAATFLQSRDEPAFYEYLGLIPSDHFVIHVAASLDLAYERSQGRKMKKRVPVSWQGNSDQEMRDNLRYFDELVRLGCEYLRQNGARVIQIDASLPVAESASELACAVMAIETGQDRRDTSKARRVA